MIIDNFFSYRNYRWMWVNVTLLLALTVIYLLDDPLGGPNGGTVVGYAYGIIGALGILYLMWFGVRKRSYAAHRTTLKGCLSAHVWLGISLTFIVPMHSGFSFGLNIHTLAYVLMVVVILSGIWGAMQYVQLAPQIHSHRGGATVKKLLEQIAVVSKDIGALAKQRSDSFLQLLSKVDFEFNPSLARAVGGQRPPDPKKDEVAALMAKVPENEHADALKLVTLAEKKRNLVTQVYDEAEVMTRLKGWLYLHLPVSFALLAALIIHIVSVFYFW